MSTSYSERKIQQMEVEEFEDKLDKLLHGYGQREDIIWLLAVAVHNEAVQKIVNSRYLKMQGYDLKQLKEKGGAFIKSILEANEQSETASEGLNTLIRWRTLTTKDGEETKQHAFIAKNKTDKLGREYEGNISLCGQFVATKAGPKELQVTEIWGEPVDENKACKNCLKCAT